MKKTLIALAALSATAAFAQSSVTLFGTFDPSVQNIATTYGGGAKSTQNTVGNSARGTSQISVKGVEDLGGGLNAIFLYEGDFHMGSNPSSLTSAGAAQASGHSIGALGGEIYAGLEGRFGSLKVGTPNTPSLGVQAGRQPFGTKVGSGFGGVNGTSHVREASSLVYASPAVAGFTASVGYAFKAGQTASVSTGSSTNSLQLVAGTALTAPQGSKVDLALNYANGPLRAGLSYFVQDATPAFSAANASPIVPSSTAGSQAAGKNKQTNLFVQYDIAPATVYFGYHSETLAANALTATNATSATNAFDWNGVKQSGYNVGVKVAVTPAINLLGNYGKLNDKSSLNLDKTIAGIGGEYLLSKRSTVYVRHVQENNKNIPTAATSSVAKVVTTLVGLQHNF